MKNLVLICLIILIPTFSMSMSAQPKAGKLVVYHDTGGYVDRYRSRIRKYDTVEIRGMCQSACTLYLAIENICITPNAKFWFHAARWFNGPISHSGTRDLYNSYPEWVQTWIDDNGGLQKDWIKMPSSYALKYLPKCN